MLVLILWFTQSTFFQLDTESAQPRLNLQETVKAFINTFYCHRGNKLSRDGDEPLNCIYDFMVNSSFYLYYTYVTLVLKKKMLFLYTRVIWGQ